MCPSDTPSSSDSQRPYSYSCCTSLGCLQLPSLSCLLAFAASNQMCDCQECACLYASWWQRVGSACDICECGEGGIRAIVSLASCVTMHVIDSHACADHHTELNVALMTPLRPVCGKLFTAHASAQAYSSPLVANARTQLLTCLVMSDLSSPRSTQMRMAEFPDGTTGRRRSHRHPLPTLRRQTACSMQRAVSHHTCRGCMPFAKLSYTLSTAMSRLRLV